MEAARLLQKGIATPRSRGACRRIGNRSGSGRDSSSKVDGGRSRRRAERVANRAYAPKICGASSVLSSVVRKHLAMKPACGRRRGWRT